MFGYLSGWDTSLFGYLSGWDTSLFGYLFLGVPLVWLPLLLATSLFSIISVEIIIIFKYSWHDSGICSFLDIDECVAGTANCASGTVCENVLGSFLCTNKSESSKCSKGYYGVGVRCVGRYPNALFK